MHPRRSAQEIHLCDLCETPPLESHCELCNISLCKACVLNHLSDSTKLHKVVTFLQHARRKATPNYPKCQKHTENHCTLHCEQCDISVCSVCVSSGKHKDHNLSDVMEKFRSKTRNLQQDLEELEKRIYPRFEEMAFDVETQKAEIDTNYGKLIVAADEQGEFLHGKITAIVNQRKSDIQELKNKHLSTLNTNTEEITQKISELKQRIAELKSTLKSNDVTLTSKYKSRNSEFRTLPLKVRVTIPSFIPQKLNTDQLNEMFGSLSSLYIKTEHGETLNSSESVLPPPVKPMLDEPRVTATTDTGFEKLYSVSCLSENEFWARGNSNIIKFLNIQGELLTSIQTRSEKGPWDMTLTRDGDLMYTDFSDKTVNLVKDKQIRTMITLQGWTPRNISSTSSDDFLVTMDSDDGKQSKVVRYSGSTETQTFQFDDQGRPLYSSGLDKYITENKNLDICLADWTAREVVVVNQSGKLRFRYTGQPSNTNESFHPLGITTDSQSQILTTDFFNDRIHILDQDGQFLRYIHNLHTPFDLCVDIRENLFVAERDTAKVKKVHYLQTQY